MKLKEKFLKSGLTTDIKARRRTNVTKDIASITADQLERGVTIEELSAIGVPVYRYETQVTIHGNLPGLRQARVNGYKSLVENGNGSLGVKYVAIDSEKKQLLRKACRVLGSKFRGSFNSQGFTLFTSASSKADIVAEYESFPRDLIHGSIYAGALMYGGFGLFIEVGCIDADKVDALLTYLTGKSELECMKAIEAFNVEQDRKHEEREAQAASNAKERANARVALVEKLKVATQHLEPLSELPKAGKVQIAVGFDGENVKWKFVEFAKRGPVYCYKVEAACFDKFRKYPGAYDKALAEGRVFSVDEKPKPEKPSEKPKPAKQPASGGLLTELKACIEWQGVEAYVTKKGKFKPLLTGIPSQGFWLLWKHEKQAIKELGVTIFAEKAEGTGTYRTVRGKSFEVKKKAWLVQVWRPEAFGFSSKGISGQAIDCPF
jgi:hypothetical protein